MASREMIQVPRKEYQALVQRVEKLERIVEEKLGTPAEPSRGDEDIRATLQELQTKYAQYPSFNRALLRERTDERNREQARLRPGRVRAVRPIAKRGGARTGRRADRKRGK